MGRFDHLPPDKRRLSYIGVSLAEVAVTAMIVGIFGYRLPMHVPLSIRLAIVAAAVAVFGSVIVLVLVQGLDNRGTRPQWRGLLAAIGLCLIALAQLVRS